jgi:DNA-binding MarR family transcriptional regulator
MLNIHTKLLDLIKEKKITTDEFVILLLISKRVGKKKTSFPSIKLLQEESTFGRDKVQRTIISLEKKGFITKSQRKLNWRFSSNFYKIKTNLIGVLENI